MNRINRVDFFQMNNIDPIHLNGNISINTENNDVKSFKQVVGEMMGEINEITNK